MSQFIQNLLQHIVVFFKFFPQIRSEMKHDYMGFLQAAIYFRLVLYNITVTKTAGLIFAYTNDEISSGPSQIKGPSVVTLCILVLQSFLSSSNRGTDCKTLCLGS